MLKSAGTWWLLGGLLCVALSYAVGNRYNWQPVSQPVALTPGPIETAQFETNKDAYYEIAIDVNKNMDAERTECLLGIDPGQDPQRCKDMASVVDIAWTVTKNGAKVTDGSSADSREVYTSDRVGRVIGEFWGTRGSRYAVSLKVNRDGSPLATADPRLIVKMNDEDSKNYAVISQVLFFGGISFGLLGVVLMLNAGKRERAVAEQG